MRFLIIGGTRFLGKKVAETLAFMESDVTVLSRRRTELCDQIRHVCAERVEGLHFLSGEHFDAVLDFICYDNNGPQSVVNSVITSRYVMISSVWVPRIWYGTHADEFCPDSFSVPNPDLPEITQKYLLGKIQAEYEVSKLYYDGRDAVSLRLPIVLGEGDHTGRLDFYCSRFSDSGPVIAVDAGLNKAQFVWVDDTALAIARWIIDVNVSKYPIWEGLPDNGQTVRSILLKIGGNFSSSPVIADVSSVELKAKLPNYLEKEPLWRERSLDITPSNLFNSIGINSTDITDWAGSTEFNKNKSLLRQQELNFLNNRSND